MSKHEIIKLKTRPCNSVEGVWICLCYPPSSVGSVFCIFEISRIGGGESHPTLHVVRVPPGLQSRVSHRRMAKKGLLWFVGRKVRFAKGTEPYDLLNDSNGLTIGTIPRATVAQLSNCPSNMHRQEISCSSPTQPFRTNVWSSKPLRPLGGRSFHELSERSGCTTS